MKYIPPFRILKQYITIANSKTDGNLIATMNYDDFEKLISLMLHSLDFDEKWYLETYTDVDRAVRDGLFESGRAHFVRNGYFEGRLPFHMPVDETWYLKKYEDIGQAVAANAYDSGEEHFRKFGYEEGRLPAKGLLPSD